MFSPLCSIFINSVLLAPISLSAADILGGIPPHLCSNCELNPVIPGLSVCQECSQDLLDSFDEYMTNALTTIALYATPKDIERVLINHMYDLQKGFYHNLQKN